MFLGIGILVFFIILGLCAAVYNLTNEEGRKDRLERRRAQRKNRR
jgi:F0F1-type ATP synthase assembly protein I